MRLMKIAELYGVLCLYKCAGESDMIRDMLSNQHLVRMLCHLDMTRRPDVDVEAAMHEPIFTEFVDECLRIVEPQSK